MTLAPYNELTPRELEVLKLTAEGHSTQSTADAMHVSGETVKTHRKRLMEKLDARNMPHAVAIGYREELLP